MTKSNITETVTTVHIEVDLLTDKGKTFRALLPMTITVDNTHITIGSYGGPDMFRATLEDLGVGKSYEE